MFDDSIEKINYISYNQTKSSISQKQKITITKTNRIDRSSKNGAGKSMAIPKLENESEKIFLQRPFNLFKKNIFFH